jgi:hypothetical protein
MASSLIDIRASIATVKSDYENELATLRAKYVGRGGLIEPIIEMVKDVSNEDRAFAGMDLGTLVSFIQGK